MNQTYSLHKITSTEEFSFSPTEYSRFKFGDGFVAEKFGVSLANSFIKDVLYKSYSGNQIVVVSSPYSFIPTATFSLKNHFVFEINKWLSNNEFPVVQETKIHRNITYKDDYGELNAEERIRLIGNDKFHIDKGFLQDKLLVFLDDIKITGSHESMITKMLSKFKIKNEQHLVYFAELENKTIHPNVENILNYYYVKSLLDLNEIIENGNFIINTRVVKYILNSDNSTFQLFIKNKNLDFIKLLANMALGNSYHMVESYKKNYEFLKETIFSNHI